MTRYTVRVSSFAADQIADYAAYIASTSGFVEVADRWLDHVYATMDQLRYNPSRFALAEESHHRDYEIHRQLIGDYLALYRIDESSSVVQVIGFRHGRRRPRPADLPVDEC